jgi:hypothetical protein
MLDRLYLLQELDRNVRLSSANSVKAEALYEKLLSLIIAEMPLADARGLGAGQRAALRAFIEGAMAMSDLKKVVKRWDPKRTISKETTQTEVRRILVELLDRRREPHVPPPKAKKASARLSARAA